MVIANFDSDRIDHPGILQKTVASVEAVREAMLQALVDAGFDIEALALPALRDAHITLKTNPIDNSEVLAVCWRPSSHFSPDMYSRLNKLTSS